jgi:hypothetical protein
MAERKNSKRMTKNTGEFHPLENENKTSSKVVNKKNPPADDFKVRTSSRIKAGDKKADSNYGGKPEVVLHNEQRSAAAEENITDKRKNKGNGSFVEQKEPVKKSAANKTLTSKTISQKRGSKKSLSIKHG